MPGCIAFRFGVCLIRVLFGLTLYAVCGLVDCWF